MKKFLKIVVVTITVFWMFFIFRMSAASAEESTGMSMSVGYTVGKMLVNEFESLPPETQEEYAESIDHPIRKAAHFTEYTILGILFSIDFLLFTKLVSAVRFFLSWIAGVVYSLTDEFHQLFVAGRSGQFTDVLIDGSGVLLGCLLILGIVWLYALKNEEAMRLGFACSFRDDIVK